jgi:hypothetical protein
MPCVLKRVVEPGGTVFEGQTDKQVVLQPAAEDSGDEVTLISARYGATKLKVKDNCVKFIIKSGVEFLRYLIQTNPPRSWVRMNEACGGCGSDDVSMLQRFKATEPPTSSSLTIRGI